MKKEKNNTKKVDGFSEKRHFYGTTTIGEKGQAVIPVAARKGMNIKKGDQLLVFGIHQNMIAFVKLDQVEEFAAHLSEKLRHIDQIIQKSKNS
ncbi:MAG TPA: AbrB/MazE/SpoVT family DNA-binding domain-containing protein [Candidatus Paceibacterota bacterium]|nr:AbrB/MazE/SpoVT family DNA-binding domain-containing protein [Candidatus Paceibacterota bacterium]